MDKRIALEDLQYSNYDDEIYLRMKDGKAYVVASSFVEEISKKCKNTLITNEYTIKKSVDHAISNVESRNEKITRLKLSNSIYDFRFCTKDSAKKDLTVYSDDVELKAGDKIYLADLYAEDDGIYYEVILADIDGILRVGEIIELNSEK